jgi:glutamate-1-semialdehyde 2,1-aminomutase
MDVIPDLATFAKAIAGGLPLSAIAGKQKIMQLVEDRRVVHAGTYNGNAVSLAAAQHVLTMLEEYDGRVLARIRRLGEELISGIRRLAANVQIPILINGVGSVFHLSFTKRLRMETFPDTLQVDAATKDQFLKYMLDSGVYLLPDGRWYISAAHTEADVRNTLGAVERAFHRLASQTVQSEPY